jgi:hypothetical protein
MKLITVSRMTHDKLAEHARPGSSFDDGKTKVLPNGTVEFSVGDDVAARLAQISPDPEVAILKAMGCAAN